ncbi:MAG TPA: asparagine synthase-related protein [Gallionella sp.]|nr:asparagine synthase-related protein [Gallionella sp.]
MFAGIVVHAPEFPLARCVDGAALFDALDPCQLAEASGAWQNEAMLLVQAERFKPTHPAHESLPYRCPQTSMVAAFWGRLDNRDALLHTLESPHNSPDGALLLAAFLRWGENCVEHLLGDFAFAIADPRQRQLFLARDPLGIKPLYYLADERFFIFGTSAAIFLQLKIGKPDPDISWAAAYLASLTPSYTDTAYKGVLKLAPGHCMTVQQGKVSLRQYFQFKDDAPLAHKRAPVWVEAYREVLEEAVRCRLDAQHPMGLENSGGMDSSTVIGVAARHCARQLADLHSFSFAFNQLEPEYMMETSRYCGIVNNHLITQLQISDEDMLQRALKVNGYPLEWSSGQSSPMYFYRWAQQLGIRSFFSGFGGDECVTSFAFHAPYEFLTNRQYFALWDALPGNPLMRALRYAKAVKNHLRAPLEFSPAMHEALLRYRQLWILRPEVAQGLYGQHDEEARYAAPYRRVNDFILHNRLSPRLTTRLENSTLMCGAYGMDYCAPLLDVRLVQQYLSTPTLEKTGNGGMGRYLHRRAVEGLVPPKIQWNRGKDNMGEKGFKPSWRAENLKRMALLGLEEMGNMHPALVQLVDEQKLSRQIEFARHGSGDQEFFVLFSRNILSLRWLNRWLNGQ